MENAALLHIVQGRMANDTVENALSPSARGDTHHATPPPFSSRHPNTVSKSIYRPESANMAVEQREEPSRLELAHRANFETEQKLKLAEEKLRAFESTYVQEINERDGQLRAAVTRLQALDADLRAANAALDSESAMIRMWTRGLAVAARTPDQALRVAKLQETAGRCTAIAERQTTGRCAPFTDFQVVLQQFCATAF